MLLHLKRQEIIAVAVSSFKHVEGVISFSFPICKKKEKMIISWHFINKVSIFVIILQTSQKVVVMLLGISQLVQIISIYEIAF